MGAVAVDLRSEAIPLARLRTWAAEWDAEGDGAHYSAERFVEWVERNLAIDTARLLDVASAGQVRR